MDPDLPVASVEGGQSPKVPSLTMSTNTPGSGRISSRRSSPDKTPYKTPLSHQPTPLKIRSGSRAGTPSHERHSPLLLPKRSFSNLSAGQSANSVPYRRTSTNLSPASPSALGRAAVMNEMLKPSPWTPSAVAKDYFKRELEQHATATTKAKVIVHDACYGHRFSRPRATKNTLATIVERPERIHATLLGASAAYVRMGERHAAGAYGPHPDRNPAAAGEVPFTIHKTSRIIPLDHPAVTSVHGARWMQELQIMCDSAEGKLAMNGKELSRPIGYGKDEEGNPLPKLHEGDLYLCAESLAALQGCLGGVCDAVDTVFSSDATSRAFVCIRPPGHHCSDNVPSGFCWLNNVHVGIAYAAMNHNLTHAAIIDFDLHHGDGSQTITWDHNQNAQTLPKNAAAHQKTPIGYYSLHDINSYPCEWGDQEKVQNASLCIHNAHGQSIWNVHLEPWTSLADFWRVYEAKYTVLLEKAKSFLRHHSDRLQKAGVEPKAAIFISAGFDANQWEGEGMQRHNVNVPTDFYAKFTEDMVKLAEEDGLAVNGRVISVLEGGYSDRALASGVLSHLCGLTVQSAPLAPGQDVLGPVHVSDRSSTVLSRDGDGTLKPRYNADWWHETMLQALEAVVAGNLPPPPKKKDKMPGNYSSPTQASTARMTEHARERQSLTAQVEARLSLETAPTEPPPDVDWTVAAYELSRLLIPTDRQTLSCRHDELNAEATRVRRERQSAIGLPALTEDRMQLRDRKTKGLTTNGGGSRAASRTSNRRTTIAAASELPDPSRTDPIPERPRRRSSAASSVLSSFQDMNLEEQNGGPFKNNSSTALSARQKANVSDSVRPVGNKRTATVTAPRRTRSRGSSPVTESTNLSRNFKSLLPRAPASGMVATDESLNKGAPSLSRQSSTGDVVSRDGMDDITSAMKKVSIKLKMPTPEQHAANQRRAEEEQAKQTKPARKPPPLKANKTKAAPTSKMNTQPKRTSPKADNSKSALVTASTPSTDIVAVPTPSLLTSDDLLALTTNLSRSSQENVSGTVSTGEAKNAPNITESQYPTMVPLVGQAPLGTTLVRPNPTAIEVGTNENRPANVPERPEAPTPATIEQSEISPAQQRRTKEDLPVFTSTSPIPFSQKPPENIESRMM